MRLLTFNWHEAYICLLAKTGHAVDIVERFKGGSKVWFYETRPLPANARIVKEATARRALRSRQYDAVVCHNLQDLLWIQEWPVRKVLVFHNKLSTEIALGRHTVNLEAYRSEVAARVAATPDLTLVFISESKRADWGLDGRVVPPGIDLDEYAGYHGTEPTVLRVGNFMRQRDLMLGFSLQQQVLGDEIPSTLLGLNEPGDGGRFTRSWDDLRQCYQRHRVYFNTTRDPYEDGYNLSMLEAMATGSPVVSCINASSPIVDGVNGFVSDDPGILRSRIQSLLSDTALATRLGAEARRTVGERFALNYFVQRWNHVLDVDVESAVTRPLAVGRAIPGPRSTRRTKVLLAYVSYPATTARYLETSLRRQHDVVTVGPAIGPEIIQAWNLQGMREPVRSHDLPCGARVDLEKVVRALPGSWQPDLMLWVESVKGYQPMNVPRLDCPTAAYVIDSHINLPEHLEWVTRFDWVFAAQRAYLDAFRAAGCSRVHWLPLACDASIHGKVTLPKRHDLGFVGSLTPEHAQRQRRLARLAERFDVHVERSFLRDMARTFAASRIVFNDAIKDDLNMRVFEALASGSMLLTDRAPGSGLDEMFVDRQHLVYYDDATLEALVEYYLAHPNEREMIAEQGRQEVLRWHTYDHRMTTLLETIFDEDDDRADDPARPIVVTDPLLDDGLRLIRERQFGPALERLLAISGSRDLDVLERVVCHKAVADCLSHAGAADDVHARRRAALDIFDTRQASRVLPLLAA